MADFRADGVAVVDWARSRGFSAALVYSVLRGERKCLRGQSFQIAKALGMK
jgi:gp16 family phage-associated protein